MIESSDGVPVTFDTNIGLLRNFTIRQTASPEKPTKRYGVWIKQGRLELEDCDISSNDAGCVMVSTNADPRLRRNRIHNGRQSGIVIMSRASGTYEDNELFGNAYSGITVSGGAFPLFAAEIDPTEMLSLDFMFSGGGAGTFEDNEFFENESIWHFCKKRLSPIIRNRSLWQRLIFRNKHFGRRSRDVLRKIRFLVTEEPVFTWQRKAKPSVRRNKINLNGYEAIWVVEGGEGIFWENDLTGNKRGAWDLANVDLSNLSIERNIEPEE